MWREIRTFIVLTFLVGSILKPGGVRAVDFDRALLEKITARMQAFVDEQEISGAVTVVGTAQGIVHLGAVGSRNLEAGQAMTNDTAFRIASMTKPITAIAIMQLVEKQQLALEDPVERHLPEFRGQMLVASRQDGVITLRKPSRPITVRDLLTHTSGLPGGYPEGFGDAYGSREHDLLESALVMSQRPLEFEPGSKWAYCNTGIDMLGRIIEVLSGTKYDEYLLREIFRPLGMKDTAVFPGSEILDRAAVVYERRDGKLQPIARPLIGDPVRARHPIPAGGLFSTAPDLARLYQLLLNQGILDGCRILSPESLATMTRLQTGELACGFVEGMGFGYGFAHVKKPTGITAMLSPGTYGHGGAFGTQGWIDPHRGIFVILLIQRSGLANGDGSPMRLALQELAFAAAK